MIASVGATAHVLKSLPALRLLCPLDGLPLARTGDGTLQCERRHSFDRAREGYYNLLPVQHKASRDPGDDKAMVAARRRVLDAGLYAPIAKRLTDLATELLDRMPPCLAVVDAGCGEGYYLDAIAEALAAAGGPVRPLAGIDISKWAIRAAAKRHRDVFWAVASNRRLPFAPDHVGVILCMFGFPAWEAFAAVQPIGGRVLLVDPGPDHLIEMRSILYPAVNTTKPPSLEGAQNAGYALEHEQRLRFIVELAGAQIGDVLAMTPHGHKAPIAGRRALEAMDRLIITGDVVFRVLHRA